jgi:cell division septation protein DedD
VTRALSGAIAALLSLSWTVLTVSVAAQEPPSLDQVDALVAAGRTEDARVVLTRWWEGSGGARGAAARADVQRALWLRGVLTVDPAQAALDYQRLVVEHPGGPWSDGALLRLAQTSEARGDAARAREQLRALLRDYPGSEHRGEAEALLAALEAGQGRLAAGAPAATPSGTPPSAAPTGGAADRPPTQRPTAPVTGGAPAPFGAAPEPTESQRGGWTVQVGAFANRVRARALLDELAAAGIDARMVVLPGSPLVRVRAGRFEDEDLAQALRRGLAVRGLDASVASDADREMPAP